MNINIDKLIGELEARKKSHTNQSMYEKDPFRGEALSAKFHECDFLLQKLIALKNEQPEAITEDSHFRKHDVGRSAAGNDISTKGNDLSESSSETQSVGQNEQTREVCCKTTTRCYKCQRYLRDCICVYG